MFRKSPTHHFHAGFTRVELLVGITMVVIFAALSFMGFARNPVEGKTTNQRMDYRHGNKAIVVCYDGSF